MSGKGGGLCFLDGALATASSTVSLHGGKKGGSKIGLNYLPTDGSGPSMG